MDYLKMLEHSYKMYKEITFDKDATKLEYLASGVFDFITYEDHHSQVMATKCIEVCLAITNKTTYEYISSECDYRWYLIMVNMPFFQNKLEWGTSIRGAWWDVYGDETISILGKELFWNERMLEEVKFKKEEWDEFINALADFAELK